MSILRQLLSSPEWWFSTIVMAFVVNVISSYFKSWIDSYTTSIIRTHSFKSKMKAYEKIKSDLQEIEEYHNDKGKLYLYFINRVFVVLFSISLSFMFLLTSGFMYLSGDFHKDGFVRLMIILFITIGVGVLIASIQTCISMLECTSRLNKFQEYSHSVRARLGVLEKELSLPTKQDDNVKAN